MIFKGVLGKSVFSGSEKPSSWIELFFNYCLPLSSASQLASRLHAVPSSARGHASQLASTLHAVPSSPRGHASQLASTLHAVPSSARGTHRNLHQRCMPCPALRGLTHRNLRNPGRPRLLQRRLQIPLQTQPQSLRRKRLEASPQALREALPQARLRRSPRGKLQRSP